MISFYLMTSVPPRMQEPLFEEPRIIKRVIDMEQTGRKFASFEDMEEADVQESLSMTPEERLQQLSLLKQQFMDFRGLDPEDFDSHLRESTIEKKPVPWA